VTLILMAATFALLTFLGVSCRRARLDLEEQLCECLHNPMAAAVGYGGHRVELVSAAPVLTGIEGGRHGSGGAAGRGDRHLRVVEAG
jgi:hypothetical protein